MLHNLEQRVLSNVEVRLLQLENLDADLIEKFKCLPDIF